MVVTSTYHTGAFFHEVAYAAMRLLPVAFVNRKASSKP